MVVTYVHPNTDTVRKEDVMARESKMVQERSQGRWVDKIRKSVWDEANGCK